MTGQDLGRWFSSGTWWNKENFGVVDVVRPTPTDNRLDLAGKVEKLAEEEDEEMIRNQDGTPYNVDCVTNDQFDPSNPDHALMDSIDQEAIDKGGSPVEYYRVVVDGNVDEFYMEQRQKVFAQKVHTLKSVWEPVPPEWMFMTGGGGFSSDEITRFSFNRQEFLEVVGEMPRIGSLIKTCIDGVFWEITNREVNTEGEDRKMWGRHRLVLIAQKYQSTISDPSPTMQGRESQERGHGPYRVR
jgi:hypothetical protein